jgi:hypothetical protein
LITINGLEIDSIEMVARLPVDKVEKIFLCCKFTRIKIIKLTLPMKNPTNGDHLYA